MNANDEATENAMNFENAIFNTSANEFVNNTSTLSAKHRCDEFDTEFAHLKSMKMRSSDEFSIINAFSSILSIVKKEMKMTNNIKNTPNAKTIFKSVLNIKAQQMFGTRTL